VRAHGLRRAAALVLLLLAVRPALAAAPDQVLRVALSTELQVLDPLVTTINATRVFAYLVFDTLVGVDGHGNYKPQMLDGWEVSQDRLTWTFRLRDGLEWSDGAPVTAEDCVASIRRWAKREPLGGKLMAAAADLHALDARSFVLVLNRPFALVIEALGKPGHTIPVMMPTRLAAHDPSTQAPEIVGSGPFLFLRDEWRPGERASFVRNPRYRPRPEPADGLSGGKSVKVDRVELISIPDLATKAAALEAGEIDYVEIAPLDYIERLRRNPAITVGAPRGVDQFLAVLNINHAAPPFDNVLVRRAAQAAVLQPEVMDAMGLPPDLVTSYCGSIYMCGTPGASEAGTDALQVAGTQRAQALLREAGYHGEPVVLLHAQTSALLNPVGLVMSDQLRRAGFNVDLRSSDYATVAQKRLSRAPEDQGGWSAAPLVLNGIDLVDPLANPLLTFNCSPVQPGWYCDGEITTLLARYSEAATPETRRLLADKLQAAAHSDVTFIVAASLQPLEPGVPAFPVWCRSASRCSGVSRNTEPGLLSRQFWCEDP